LGEISRIPCCVLAKCLCEHTPEPAGLHVITSLKQYPEFRARSCLPINTLLELNVVLYMYANGRFSLGALVSSVSVPIA